MLKETLSIILTRSFEDGKVVSVFKESIVHKRKSRLVPENYRPIAQGRIIMEDMIAEALFRCSFIVPDFYLSMVDPNEHEFTRGKSTCIQLGVSSRLSSLPKVLIPCASICLFTET